MKNRIDLVYKSVNALVLWFALILQFFISTKLYTEEGRSTAGALLQIISYYTIQTNLLIAVALTCILIKPKSAAGKFFSRTSVLTAIAVYIIIVGLIYAVILKGIWKLEGLFKLTDFLLHTLSPIAYILFWILFVPKDKIKWRALLAWALFPFLYLIYALIRGSISGEYPYPFVDAAKFGYVQVVINAIGVLLLFLAISSVFIGITRLYSKKP